MTCHVVPDFRFCQKAQFQLADVFVQAVKLWSGKESLQRDMSELTVN